MEYVVKSSLGRKSEAHSYLIDNFSDEVGSIEPWLQLARDGLLERRRSTVLQAEQRPIAHVVAHWTMMGVVVPLVRLLRLFNPVADICEKNVPLLHSLGDGRHTTIARLIRMD